MFKRLLVLTAAAVLLGQLFVAGVNHVRGGSFFSRSEASKKAAEFEKVLKLIHENYVSPDVVAYQDLATTAFEAIPRSLDPHSEFLSGDEFENFKADASQEFGGIGVRIEMRDDHVTVVAPIGGTPGERAGLMRGDQVKMVDGIDVVGKSLDDCLKLLRGKPGHKIHLSMFRPRTNETYECEIVREIIQIESVDGARMLDEQLGYLRLQLFGERTAGELRETLSSLEKQGMRALVLDLRDNPGGLLDSAVEVSEMFFRRGELIVYTQGRTEETREDITSLSREAPRSYPIAVLINSGSASASEIVAGAFRDTGRAVLVGETSFGKGSVQTVYPIGGTNDAIRLTTAYYYLPSGERINGKGIAPDIPITLSVEDERKLVIQRNRLPLMSDEEFVSQYEFAPIEDRQLAAAADALRGVLAVESIASGANSD